MVLLQLFVAARGFLDLHYIKECQGHALCGRGRAGGNGEGEWAGMGRAFAVQDNILGLQVTVDDVLLMEVIQGQGLVGTRMGAGWGRLVGVLDGCGGPVAGIGSVYHSLVARG